MIDASLTGDSVIVASNSGIHVISSKAVVISSGDIYVAVPSDGTYFVCASIESYPFELTKEEIETIHPIDLKYLPEGGVGYTAKEVFTYDGKGETITLDGIEFAMLVDKAIDPYSIVKIMGIMYGNTIEVSKNDITVQKVSGDGSIETAIYTVYANYGGTAFPVIVIWDTAAAGGHNITYVISDSDGDGHISRIETETIHKIEPKYLPDNVVNCDALTCTTADGTVMSFSEVVVQLFQESFSAGTPGTAKVMQVIDNNGAFKQAVSDKQSIVLKQTALGAVINYPATFTINIDNGEIAQLSSFAILLIPFNGIKLYGEIKFNIQFSNTQDTVLMV